MTERVFIGIDPAAAKTGVTLWCEGEEEISTVLVQPKKKMDKKKNFHTVYEAGRDITAQMGGMFRQIAASGCSVVVVMEHPPPNGSWAAGLFLVDGLILSRLHRLGWSVHLVDPTRIDTLLTPEEDPNLDKTVQRKTKFTKKERREYLFEILEANGLRPKLPPGSRPNKKMGYDEADACLLMLYVMHNLSGKLKLPKSFVEERWLLKEVPIHGR